MPLGAWCVDLETEISETEVRMSGGIKVLERAPELGTELSGNTGRGQRSNQHVRKVRGQ